MNRVENRTYPVFSPLLVKYDFDADFECDADINDRLEATIPKVNSLTAEIDENDYKLEGIYRGVTFIPFMEEGDKDLIDEEIVSRVEKIEILNPYDICFAFVTMLDENSDYVWAYNGCYVILRLACMALPWGESYCIEPQHFDDDLDIPDEFVDLMQHQKTELTIKQM